MRQDVLEFKMKYPDLELILNLFYYKDYNQN